MFSWKLCVSLKNLKKYKGPAWFHYALSQNQTSLQIKPRSTHPALIPFPLEPLAGGAFSFLKLFRIRLPTTSFSSSLGWCIPLMTNKYL